MATWPATLPNATLDGYAIEAGDPTIRTDMESGPARVRRRFTAVPDGISVSFIFDDTQMLAFRAFWNGDAQQGAVWFYLPVKDGLTAGVNSKEVRPNPAKFSAKPLGPALWSVSFGIEVRSA